MTSITRSNKLTALVAGIILLASIPGHADRITAGDAHSLAAKWDGSQFVWGANDNGQFGDGTELDSLNPVPVVDIRYNALDRALAVVSHGNNNLVLIDDDTLLGWGPNENLQLGSGLLYSGNYLGEVPEEDDGADDGTDDEEEEQPEEVVGNPLTYPEAVVDSDGKPIANIVSIALGANFAAAINQEGQVLVWGNLDAFENREQDREPVNRFRDKFFDPDMEFIDSRYLDGDPIDEYDLRYMIDVNGNRYSGITQIAVGDDHLLALTADGQVLSWGDNTSGQLGDGSQVQRPFPVYVRDPQGVLLSDIKHISARAGGSYAVGNNGHLLGWGSTLFTTDERFAVHVRDGDDIAITAIRSIAPGDSHVLAITFDGKVVGWGSNSNGQLGIGSNADVSGTAKVITRNGQRLADVAEIAVGSTHSLAVLHSGLVYAWGAGENGRLGDGTNIDSYFAVNVRSRSNAAFSLY
jgi:alpha-tubulin suppressor-like RCC1 family protein